MNKQWPKERYSETMDGAINPHFKTVEDFLNILDSYPDGLPESFDSLVHWIVEQGCDLSELEIRSAKVADKLMLTTQDYTSLLMTLSCAAALAQKPTLQTWSNVNTCRYGSNELTYWLSEAMRAYAKVFPSACVAYVELGKKAITALGDLSLKSMSDRANDQRAKCWSYWEQKTDRLDEIWWGLRGSDILTSYEDERALFEVFYDLDPEEYISTTSGLLNPFLVSRLLFVAGISAFSPRFSEWERWITAAPCAFENDAKWNGSIVVPLLLVDARQQLLHVRPNLQSPHLSQDELDEIRNDIQETAALITDAIAERQDATQIFSRWSSWLMRNILSQADKDLYDVRTSAFADNVMLEAIGNKVDILSLPLRAPEDASCWEAWCFRCVQASFAYNGHGQVPEYESFVKEWKISPECWAEERGDLLRNHADLFVTMNKDIPSNAAHLLAFSIAQSLSSSPVEVWIKLWNEATTLREIVEFGDSDVTEDEYKSRAEAGRLLLLLVCIGIAIFDQIAARSSDSSTVEARSAVILFNALSGATNEMREIDNTLNQDTWLRIVKHLMIRRMIWESASSENEDGASTTFQVFKTEDAPTVFDLLTREKGDVVEMVDVLQSLLLNVPVSKLKSELSSAAINVSDIVRSIRDLNECHPRKYPINEFQLKQLDTLI